MNTSFMLARRHQAGGTGTRRIITRRLGAAALALALAALLGACTTLRLAYSQAPQFSHWWLNSHFDFDDAQSAQVHEQIAAFFAWHRRHELPALAALLERWQALAPRDITPEQACEQVQAVRTRLQATGERLVEPFAQLAQSLSPAQLQHLQKRQARSNREFEREFLRGSPEQRLQRRLDTAVSRSERLYGALSEAQRDLLRRSLAESPWQAQRTQAERQRRQADLLQTLAQIQAEPSTARAALQGHLARLLHSPTPGYQAHSEANVRHGCAQFAALHNTTTPEQRQTAVRELQGYQRDMETLSAQR
jgi:hypothetical protein